MRILFLSTWFPSPPDNGSKLRVYNLLRALAQRNQVTLLSFAFDTARPDAPGELADWCHEIHVVAADPFAVNQTGTLRTFLSSRPVASRPLPSMSQQVAGVLSGQVFDAVISSTDVMVDYALHAPPGPVRILEEHNNMTRWAWERFEEAGGAVQRTRRWLSWQKSRQYEARTYSGFDLITMVSEVDRRATLNTLGNRGPRVEVVPNGVDSTYNCPDLDAPLPNTLVYNGSLAYGANYDAVRWFLAEAYPRLKAHVPDVTLAVTGSIKGVDLAGLALDDTVRLTGYVDDVRIPVSQATVCIVPIRQGGGTRLKILEAMALGTPVVATSKGAEGLDVVDGEHLLLADAPELFSVRTAELLSNPDLRHRLAANARRLVEAHYDWQAIGQHFVDLVEETVAAHRRK